jgi:hypothetical protein
VSAAEGDVAVGRAEEVAIHGVSDLVDDDGQSPDDMTEEGNVVTGGTRSTLSTPAREGYKPM